MLKCGMEMIAMVNTSTDMNHKLVTKIIEAYIKITGNGRMKTYDISYVKYQLLKKHDSYELIEMTNTEFKKEMMEVIGG